MKKYKSKAAGLIVSASFNIAHGDIKSSYSRAIPHERVTHTTVRSLLGM